MRLSFFIITTYPQFLKNAKQRFRQYGDKQKLDNPST